MLSHVPGTSVLTGEGFITDLTIETQTSMRVHVTLHLIGGKEFLLANVTLEEALSGVHVVVSSQIAEPFKGFVTGRTEVNDLSVNQA